MAPSPTGEYHIGHIRTVLYNYAYAKKHQGQFIIRIEDTDRERYVEGAIESILDVIRQYGLDWDEGPDKGGDSGPYVQSERLELYKEHTQKLVDDGYAYPCFCTEKDLEEMRSKQRAQGKPNTVYDGRCSRLDPGERDKMIEQGKPHVIRLKVPSDQIVKVKDEVYGKLEFDTNEIDDSVLLKSDGYPTYHLAVVVDDHLMNITHVLRGNDWLPSTPKHVLLYQAFGWELPTYVHLPNLKEMGENKKLSKRYGSIYAEDFLKEGYLVEAMLNFLMFLGWNPGGEKEIYSLQEFVNDFSIERVHKTDLVAFDREKLLWMNGHYIRQMSERELCRKIKVWSQKYDIDLPCGEEPRDYHFKVLSLVKDRMRRFSQYHELTHYFYHSPDIDNKLLTKFSGSEEKAKVILQGFYDLYKEVPEKKWVVGHLEKISYDFVKKNSFKNKEAFMTLRVAVTGETATPPIFDVMNVLGKDEALSRVNIYHN